MLNINFISFVDLTYLNDYRFFYNIRHYYRYNCIENPKYTLWYYDPGFSHNHRTKYVY